MARTSRSAGRWWSWWLVAHAAVVVAHLVAHGLATARVTGDSPVSRVVLGADLDLSMLLSSPWWLPLGVLWVLPAASSNHALLAAVDWTEQALRC